jgi:hypothetical protein
VENHEFLENLLISQPTLDERSLIYEDEEEEEEDVKVNEQENIGYEPNFEEIEYSEAIEREEASEESEEEELTLADIVKPEFLHYCMKKPEVKKPPEPKRKIDLPYYPSSKKQATSQNISKNSKPKIAIKSVEVLDDGLDTLTCKQCNFQTIDDVEMQNHVVTHSRKENDGKFECIIEKCPRKFQHINALTKHLKSVHQ